MLAVVIVFLCFNYWNPIQAEENRIWRLEKFDFSQFPNAKCLDGSPGGFWFIPGYGDGSNKFVVHHQGGGWCVDANDCYSRSFGSVGTSNGWDVEGDCAAGSQAPPCKEDGGSHGLLEGDSAINKLTYNWNMVFLGYCDGASFSGHVSEPVTVPNYPDQVIHYKGRWILDASYDLLLSKYGLNKASEVIITGCSAGGLSVFIHADYLNQKITSNSIAQTPPRISAIPDAGYFMDLPSIDGDYLWTPYYQNIFESQQVADSVDDDCIAYYTLTNETWRCFMAQYTLPHIQTDVFIANSMSDDWQASNIMGITCNPTIEGSCSDEVFIYLNDFRKQMIASLDSFLRLPTAGAWLCECWVHPILDVNYYWNGVQVQNQTMQDVIFSWYHRKKNIAAKRRIAIDGEFGSNQC